MNNTFSEGDILNTKTDFVFYFSYYSELFKIIKSVFPKQKEILGLSLKKNSKILLIKKCDIVTETHSKKIILNRLIDNLDSSLFLLILFWVILPIFIKTVSPFTTIIFVFGIPMLLYMLISASKRQTKKELETLVEIGYSIRTISHNPFNRLSYDLTELMKKELKNTGKISGFVCQSLDMEQNFWLPEIFLDNQTKTLVS
jgi:hypothetical protein